MKKKLMIFLLFGLVLMACDSKTTLQEYYVENQGNKHFLALDLPTSLLTGENSNLDAKQKEALQHIKKVNVLGFPLNRNTKTSFEAEKQKVQTILKNDGYKTLFSYGGNMQRAQLYYQGEEDAIDELIIFGSNEGKGFVLARVLGKDMKPENLMDLLQSVGNGQVDSTGFDRFVQLFQAEP